MKQDKLFGILEKNKISLKKYYHLYMHYRYNKDYDDIDWYVEHNGEDIVKAVESLFKSQDFKPDELLGKDYENMIRKWRELFPKGNLPSGKPARCSEANLLKAFMWFFKNYKYGWDTIFKATRLYLSENEGSKYMKTSQYFIRKDDTSTLADCCDQVINGITIVKSIKQNVV